MRLKQNQKFFLCGGQAGPQVLRKKLQKQNLKPNESWNSRHITLRKQAAAEVFPIFCERLKEEEMDLIYEAAGAKREKKSTPAPKQLESDKDKKEKAAAKPNPVDAFQTVEGEDLTGRNFALETFKKIQKQILETYSLLSNEQDRETFYDYLITNLKLYFDKFEEEMNPTVTEPTTPEYEQEKQRKTQEDTGGGESPTAGA